MRKGTNQRTRGALPSWGGLPFLSAAPTAQAVILTTGGRLQRRQEGEHGDHFWNPPGDAAGGTRQPAACVPGRMRATAKGQASGRPRRVRPRRGGMLSGTCLGVRQPGPWAPRGSHRQPQASGHSPALAARRPTEPIQRRHRAPGTLNRAGSTRTAGARPDRDPGRLTRRIRPGSVPVRERDPALQRGLRRGRTAGREGHTGPAARPVLPPGGI